MHQGVQRSECADRLVPGTRPTSMSRSVSLLLSLPSSCLPPPQPNTAVRSSSPDCTASLRWHCLWWSRSAARSAPMLGENRVMRWTRSSWRSFPSAHPLPHVCLQGHMSSQCPLPESLRAISFYLVAQVCCFGRCGLFIAGSFPSTSHTKAPLVRSSRVVSRYFSTRFFRFLAPQARLQPRLHCGS